MTYRELIIKAMPFQNLTAEQWNQVQELQKKKLESSFTALEALLLNQSRIETMCLLFDSCADILDKEVRADSVTQAVIGL